MFPTLQECSEELKDLLKEPANRGDVVEMKDLAGRFFTDVISSCAFGIQTNSLKNPDAMFRKMGKKIFEFSTLKSIQENIRRLIPQLAKFIGVSIQTNVFIGRLI